MMFCNDLGGVVECESGEKVRSHSSAVSAAHQRGRRMLRAAARPLEKGTRVKDHMISSACEAKRARC
jgi:hypothetical protein